MPTENTNPETPQTANDPKEYIRNLADLGTGANIQTKTQEELKRAENDLEIGKTFKNKGDEQIKVARGLENLDESVMKNTTIVASSVEKISEVTGEKDETLVGKVDDLLQEIEIAKEEFKKAIPDQVRELVDQNPEVEKLKGKIQGLFAQTEKFDEAKEYIKKSRAILDEIPNEILETLENIREEAQGIRSQGERNLGIANQREQRDRKLREIVDNTEKNLEPMQRTVGRDFSRESARIMNAEETRNSIGDKQTNEAIRIIKENPDEQLDPQAEENISKRKEDIKNIYPKKVEDRVRNNMEEQGRTQEEIQKKIDKTKQEINDAIEKEKQKSIPVTTTPSPYTTP